MRRVEALQGRHSAFEPREAERQAQEAIYSVFKVPPFAREVIDWADRLAVRYEYEMAFGRPQSVPDYGSLTTGEYSALQRATTGPLWRPHMTWEEAEASFLARMYELER